ncbi:TIM barrel protein [Candidatus Poribacteria bacterium]|nr:TIM barrel protein [Candidatus Poribacteria bacterium]MBT5536937.1 TIM barrel protein [Candidatus Poribacteria bacterium]MBT7096924.1 TIM barrel protein [Candidatus Poribacteria bacterium]MBT7805654.1 TIM barrel protein [Candidatus Poribacteria bacterium]
MPRLTILNSMVGSDFPAALDKHVEWGLTDVDLKDQIFGKAVADLTRDEAANAARLIADRGLTTHCLSTGFFFAEVERGEAEFRQRFMEPLDDLIVVARELRPRLVRLLAARTARRDELAHVQAYIEGDHPWLMPLYAEAVARLQDAGLSVTVENEVGGCILSSPDEIRWFFEALGTPDVCLTWDVQNLWQMGSPPTIAVYESLRDLIGYYHLKGGQSGPGSDDLKWRSSLADASWPVVEITREVVSDGVSPVICLNPSHGAARPDVDFTDIVARDIAYVRDEVFVP